VVGGGVWYGLSEAVTVKVTVDCVLPELLLAAAAVPVDEPSWMFVSCGIRPKRVMNSATSWCVYVMPENVTSALAGAEPTAAAAP